MPQPEWDLNYGGPNEFRSYGLIRPMNFEN